MAFPCLFPYGKGDFHINRPITSPTLHDWEDHLLWYQDGRFARHKVWKFVVHNMIMRKRALEQSRYFVDHQLGDPQLTVADLQERLARGDTSFTNKLLYFGANLKPPSFERLTHGEVCNKILKNAMGDWEPSTLF